MSEGDGAINVSVPREDKNRSAFVCLNEYYPGVATQWFVLAHGGPVTPHRPALSLFAWLSIAAAVLTIALKASAYGLTGSVGLLSDALESLVNLVAAIVAL